VSERLSRILVRRTSRSVCDPATVAGQQATAQSSPCATTDLISLNPSRHQCSRSQTTADLSQPSSLPIAPPVSSRPGCFSNSTGTDISRRPGDCSDVLGDAPPMLLQEQARTPEETRLRSPLASSESRPWYAPVGGRCMESDHTSFPRCVGQIPLFGAGGCRNVAIAFAFGTIFV
jgi:hypothetical protein